MKNKQHLNRLKAKHTTEKHGWPVCLVTLDNDACLRQRPLVDYDLPTVTGTDHALTTELYRAKRTAGYLHVSNVIFIMT